MQIEILNVAASDFIINTGSSYLFSSYFCTVSYQIGDGRIYTTFITLPAIGSIENYKKDILRHIKRELANNKFRQDFNEKLKEIKGVYKE